MVKRSLIFFALALYCYCTPTAFAVPPGQVITWEDGSQGPVKFEGSEHAEEGFKCDSCHPSLFQKKKGSSKMTMALLNNGQFCGACHNGKIAFSTRDTKQCHECHKRKKHHDKKDKHHD